MHQFDSGRGLLRCLSCHAERDPAPQDKTVYEGLVQSTIRLCLTIPAPASQKFNFKVIYFVCAKRNER